MGKPLELHWEALPANQQKLLRAVAETSRRWGAYLAGGTALALQLGHRQSVDLDWFTPKTLPPDDLLVAIDALGFDGEVEQNTPGTFLARVGGVKFSLFRYRYEMVAPPVDGGGFDIASLHDLGAMKLAAIIGRATKRDYVDVYELLAGRHLTLPLMVQAFEAKYPGADVQNALRALTYFGDAAGAMPIMLKTVKWEKITADLTRLAGRYLK